MVLLFAAVITTVWTSTDKRESVLVLSRNVSAGQVLTNADLTTTRISRDSALNTIDISQEPAVIGRTVIMPESSGSMLNPSDIGPAAWPPHGQAVVGLALKSGAYPPEVAAGDHVAAVLTASGLRLGGTVLGVTASTDGSGGVVVSLLMSQNDAYLTSTAGSGNVSLVQLPPGGTS